MEKVLHWTYKPADFLIVKRHIQTITHENHLDNFPMLDLQKRDNEKGQREKMKEIKFCNMI